MKMAFTLGFRLLKDNKKRTFAIIMAASLVAAMITAVWILATSAQQVFKELNKLDPNKMQYHVQMQNIPDEKLPIIERHQLVRTAAVEKNIGYAVFNKSQNEYKKYLYVKSVESETFEEAPFVLSNGRWPKNSKEIVVPLHLKTNGMADIEIGDKLTLKVGTRINKDTKEILGQDSPMYDESLAGDENKKGLVNEGVINTTAMTFTVTGFMKRPSYSVEPVQAPGYTVITTGVQTGAYSKNTSNVSVVYYNPNEIAKSTREIVQSLGYSTENLATEEDLSYYGDYILDEKSKVILRYNDAEEDFIYNGTAYYYYEGLEFITAIAVILTIVLVLFSISAIYNTFSVCLQAQLKEFALLRSMGTTFRQIKHILYSEGVLLGGVVAVLGSMLGFVGTWVLIRLMAPYVQNVLQESVTLQYTVSLKNILIAFAVIFATVFLSVYLQARKVKKNQILDILFEKSLQVKNTNIRSSSWIQQKLGFEAALAFKNMSRNRKVYISNFTSLITSVLLIFAFAIFFDKTGLLTNNDKIQPYDLELNVSAEQINRELYYQKKPAGQDKKYSGSTIKRYTTKEYLNTMAGYETNLEQSENIRTVVGVYGTFAFQKTEHIPNYNAEYETGETNGSVRAVNEKGGGNRQAEKSEAIDYVEQVYIQVVSDSTMNKLFPDHRENPLDENAVPVGVMYNAYGGSAAKIGGLNKGDALTVDTGNGKQITLFVAQESSTKLDLNLRTYEVNVFMTVEYYNKLVQENAALNMTPGDNYFYIQTLRHSKAEEDIREIFRDPQKEQVIFTDNSAEKNKDFAQKVLIYTFSVGLLTLVLLIALTNVYNTIHVNLSNRRREFSILKSVGLTNKSLSKMLMYESSFYVLQTIFSAFLVLFVCNALSYALWGADPFAYVPKWYVIIGVTFMLFLVLFLAMRYFSRGLYKKDFMVDVKGNR